MADFVAFAPVRYPEPIWYGDLLEASSSEIEISDGFRFVRYSGNFVYDNFGDVVDGTLNEVYEARGGSPLYQVTGLSAPAAEIYYAIQILGSSDLLFDLTTGGNDTFSGSAGADAVSAGLGSDRLEGRGGDDALVGESGADTLLGGAGRDTLTGGAGNDILKGGAGSDDLFGGNKNDRLLGGDGADDLAGGKGADRLIGGGGKDLLKGGGGRDWLKGGKGDDTLSGGAGVDRFVFKADGSDDTVTDYTPGTDMLILKGLGFGSVQDVLDGMAQVGADVVLQINANTTVTLDDTTLGSLEANTDGFVL